MKSFEGSILERNRTSGVIGLASGVLFVAAIVASALARSDVPRWIAVYAIWPPFIALAHHLGWMRAKTRPARLEVSKGTVSEGGTLYKRATRARIIPQPAGRGAVVELARRFDPYPARVALPTMDDARAFVRALGLDPREGATRFRAPVSTATRGLLLAILLANAGAAFAAFGLPGALVVSAVFVALAFVAYPTYTIGRDGILIEQFFQERFVPYSEVVALEREERQNWRGQPMVSRGFTVRLAAGASVFIDTTRERMRDRMFEGDHLFDAAVAARELSRAGRPHAADALSRGGRPTKEWLRQLEGATDVRYRVAALSHDELANVLANPSADKTARAGAAICLARAGEEARVQVRVAAEDIAEPDVRKAALAALEDDEEALAAALEALE